MINRIGSEILLRILCSSPTYSSLFAAVLVSKSFHQVYLNHATQVLKEVGYNHVGPAWDLALQVVQHDIAQDSDTEDSDDEAELALKEARLLAENANVVAELEKIFSFRRKDYKSRTSQLNFIEKWRFAKAIYRLMLYSRIFPSNNAYNIIYDGVGRPDHAQYPGLDDEREQRKQFLSQIFTTELNQLRVVAQFLDEIIRWVDSVDSSDMRGFSDFVAIALSAGPAVILDCYMALGLEPLTEAINRKCPETTPAYLEDTRSRPFLSGYLFDSIAQVLQGRDAEDSHSSFASAPWSNMLDSEMQLNDQCSQCGNKVYAWGLWGKTTWDYLSLSSPILGTYLFPAASNFIKGELQRNPVDSKHVHALLLSIPFKEIYNDIYTKPGLKLSTYKDKDDDDYICYGCMTTFIKDHLHLWVAMKRREANEKVGEDCWYGYSCRTQVHKLRHAQQLNHLCEPKK